ncbi:MAG: hypothetical protein IRY85_04865 [Micromonosporaceae bacterium]|nr:hypothetical protein [Micromonosporaceae bacterium]
MSSAVAAVLLLVPLTACSGGSELSTPSDSGATTTPAGTTTSAPDQAIENGLYYYPPVQAATLKYESSGGLGAATTDVTVNSVTSGADGQTVAVTEVISSAGGQPVTVERTLHTGADGSLRMNAGAFFAFGAGFTVAAEGDDIVIPSVADLEAGKESTGSTFVELSGSGMSMRNDVSYTIKGAGRESVTVPAGTAEAYVVELELDITSSIAGAATGHSRYWFVPGFGLVRQEFTVTVMSGTTELVSSSVPLP